jgi:predicted short-subunit dehydrogenase-like oxidoreductase (DUF2520 family)
MFPRSFDVFGGDALAGTKKMMLWKVALIGAGAAARGMARGFRDAGIPVVSIHGRGKGSAEALVADLGLEGCRLFENAAEAAEQGNLVLLAVPDKAIVGVVSQIVREGGLSRGDLVLHLSGALPAIVMDGAGATGARIGSLHPLLSFSGEGAGPDLASATFAVEGDPEVLPLLVDLVRRLGAVPVTVDAAGKSLYHAAAAMISNYTVTLFDAGLGLFKHLGIEEKPGINGLISLLRSTLGNIDSLGVPHALTGPVARGDVNTVEGHLASLKERVPHILPLYATLGLRTLDVAARKGSLSKEDAEVMRIMFTRHL